jgi:hypothetical protein
MSNGTTIGIWLGDDDTLVEDFDDALGQRPDYSRSEMVKEAMRLSLTVEDALADIEYDFPNERAKRSFVRQAIMTQARVEAERD